MDPKLPNDGFMPERVLPMGPAPEPDFDESVCLKGGGCQLLWERTVNFDAGNAAGTFEKGQEPKEILRGCLRNPAGEAPLNGLTVFTCNSHTNQAFRTRPTSFVFDEPNPELAKAKLPFVRLNKKENT